MGGGGIKTISYIQYILSFKDFTKQKHTHFPQGKIKY